MNFFNKQSLSSSSSHAPAVFQTLQGSYLRQELFFSVSWLLSWSLHLQAMLPASLMSSSASLLGIKCQNHLFVYSHNPYMLFFGVTVPKQRTPPQLWWRRDFNVMDTIFFIPCGDYFLSIPICSGILRDLQTLFLLVSALWGSNPLEWQWWIAWSPILPLHPLTAWMHHRVVRKSFAGERNNYMAFF